MVSKIAGSYSQKAEYAISETLYFKNLPGGGGGAVLKFDDFEMKYFLF